MLWFSELLEAVGSVCGGLNRLNLAWHSIGSPKRFEVCDSAVYEWGAGTEYGKSALCPRGKA